MSMKMDCRLLCLWVCLVLAACRADNGRPSSVQCSSDSECSQGQCCVYVPGRYGATSCLPVGRPQEQCRPIGKPTNYTVAEPNEDGQRAQVLAHYAICPCAIGLTCSHTGTCVQDIPLGSESHPAQVPVKP